MQRNTIQILSNNFEKQFQMYLSTINPSEISVHLNAGNFALTICGALPPLEALMDGASGEIAEKVLFEGLLTFAIITLNGRGDLPVKAVDYVADHFSASYDEAKKHLPALRVFEENEEFN